MKTGILLGQLDDPSNEAALIRTAEAFGISDVHYVGDRTKLPSCGAENHMQYHDHDSFEEFGRYADANNHSIVCVTNEVDSSRMNYQPEQTHSVSLKNDSVSVSEMDEDGWPTNPIFVVGNETTGVPSDVRAHSRNYVEIEQSPHGYVRCLNASVAGAIVIQNWYSSL